MSWIKPKISAAQMAEIEMRRAMLTAPKVPLPFMPDMEEAFKKGLKFAKETKEKRNEILELGIKETKLKIKKAQLLSELEEIDRTRTRAERSKDV